jgi:hypothetical protein
MTSIAARLRCLTGLFQDIEAADPLGPGLIAAAFLTPEHAPNKGLRVDPNR